MNDSWSGAIYATAAYGFWGLTPLYWKAVEEVPPGELLGHRILWSCAVGAALVVAARAWPEMRRCLTSPRHGLPILLAAWLLAGNWLVFLWAIATDRVLATSLGYYVTPLVNVGLGVAFLGERLSGAQLAALALATAGVVILAVGLGEPPWIALAPCAAAYLLTLGADGGGALPGADGRVQALVAGSGVVTAAPLLWFNSAARRLRLATLGFFQYLAPSVAFLLAVFAFGEAFTRTHALAFGCVWLALALYGRGAFRASGARPAPAAEAIR